MASEHRPRVYIVDDDDGVRAGLTLLLASCGIRADTYACAQDFLDAVGTDSAGCALLDVRMPGISGLDLHARMLARDIVLPVIILTGHGDVPTAVRAMKHGAFDFIEKPFNDQLLLDRVNEALALDAEQREQRRRARAVYDKLQTLTAREREVMDRLVQGQANKAIAADLGISERTVELHRAHVMEKLAARSVAQIVQMAYEARQGAN